MEAIGPVPLAGMLLSDMGAEITLVERPAGARVTRTIDPERDVLRRGRRAITIDVQTPQGLSELMERLDSADVLLEGHRPGVMERLGAGPDTCRSRNPRLIYARMTGWGQEGPRSGRAGHDLAYLAVAGSLHAMGYADRPPTPPLNLTADYGGGAMLLAFGVAAALYERERSGLGQVIDAAMVDGVALLSTVFHSLLASGHWSDEREANLLDGGAPFYRVYQTADERFLAVAALEPQFYAELLRGLELDPADFPQLDREHWPEHRRRFASVIAAHDLAYWSRRFDGTDACVAGANTFAEAHRDAHLAARRTFVEAYGLIQPAPAPRFSRTPGAIAGPPAPRARS